MDGIGSSATAHSDRVQTSDRKAHGPTQRTPATPRRDPHAPTLKTRRPQRIPKQDQGGRQRDVHTLRKRSG
ncbi:hypothetical protein CONPUDRAFT_84161 [Coniophora puteana RWD-64-598 SS2]|uniref:Uncharacterized protein n=1 Tax=Coniophora puteana (strain RWD-64-598) TaxID=741705 RepID=A0A5M3MF70_CONPW|nr:uncharacterized protein CONPUDRAFT_84161 [Coniophora puteana RWD-64-598 SS2]EIW77852.1 hypothetical protein CONPUDRAFT_84161 [Coniophora puteana RWD-64-598 SS2]